MSIDFNELLEKSPLSIVVCDAKQRIVWCNEQFLTDTGLLEEQVTGHLYASLPLDAIDKDAQIVQLFSENTHGDVRFQYWHTPLSQNNGMRAHYFTRERQSADKMSLATARFSGKRLPKRANWVEFLDYEVSRSRRYDNPLSVLKLHLIFYSKPDSVTDETLAQTVNDTLTDQLRWADMIGHTDQGSYLLVLPETPEPALDALQEKISTTLKKQMGFISESIDFQIVFGYACWQKHDDSQKLLQRAREQLVRNLELLLDDKKPG
ncbi:sensor domain-containing diguanylate cyclase [Aliikangiella maris]|uniref:PAS domain-containing protein n=2 Tax=Aliikangiella maris TaxID=3162458 RepID=A0ABV2BVV3_9GAMM